MRDVPKVSSEVFSQQTPTFQAAACRAAFQFGLMHRDASDTSTPCAGGASDPPLPVGPCSNRSTSLQQQRPFRFQALNVILCNSSASQWNDIPCELFSEDACSSNMRQPDAAHDGGQHWPRSKGALQNCQLLLCKPEMLSLPIGLLQ